MNDEVPNIVRFWKENNEQSFYGWQRIHEKTQELMPLMEQHVAVQLQHAESEQSKSADCKTIQRERMKDYLTVRKFPEDINRESSLELISYQAAWASGELAKRIEVDLRGKFIPAFGADERCMICNLSMEWNFYGSVLRTSQDLQEKNGEAGFPFSVQVAEENSEMLRRLSAEKYISIHDWTRFLIADKRGIVEAVRLNRWIELKTGNKPPFDGEKYSDFMKREFWWKLFSGWGKFSRKTSRESVDGWLKDGTAKPGIRESLSFKESWLIAIWEERTPEPRGPVPWRQI